MSVHHSYVAAVDLLTKLTTPRPAAEYHEDMGPVLWWRWETEISQGLVHPPRWAGEPPYVGSPLDCGIRVQVTVEVASRGGDHADNTGAPVNLDVGGWRDGYYTHFTPIPIPELPHGD